jgi:glutathione S-transferase
MRKVYGVSLSPYVRKVLMTLNLKGLDYEMVHCTPMDKPEGFEELSPLGKIPAYIDDAISISDSSVICQYLEDTHPDNPIFPTSPIDKAKVRWFEEYADTKMIEVCGSGLFFERVVKPAFLQIEPDEERVRENLEHEMPKILSYLESKLDGNYIIGEQLTLADITIGSNLLNARYANYEIDAQQWPKLAAYFQRLCETDCFKAQIESDKVFLNQ